MGKLQTRLGGERDEAIFGLGRQAAQQVVEQRAPPNSASPRGAIVLPFLVALAALAGIPSVSAHTWVESPRDLCIQAIQSAIIDRTRDLFEDIYLPDRHQVCMCLGVFATQHLMIGLYLSFMTDAPVFSWYCSRKK